MPCVEGNTQSRSTAEEGGMTTVYKAWMSVDSSMLTSRGAGGGGGGRRGGGGGGGVVGGGGGGGGEAQA